MFYTCVRRSSLSWVVYVRRCVRSADGPGHRVEVRPLQAVHGVHPRRIATSGSVQHYSGAALGAAANHRHVPTLASVET